MKKRWQAGFTLIELVISLAIMGVIGLLAVDMLSQGAKIYVDQSIKKKFNSQSRSAFWHIQQHLRNQTDAANYFQSGPASLSISEGTNSTVTYRILNDGTLTFEKNSTTYTLADGISYSESGFSYFDSDYNDITPAAGNTLSEVQARNVHLAKINICFTEQEDTLELSTHMYPNNFRFGSKKSYHQ